MELSNLKRAHALRRANDMQGAFIAYQESASQENDANAHAWLSTCYLMGYGTDWSPEKAFEHASKSAAASNPLGKNNLGYCLQHGIGTQPDPKTAFQMYQESAATGNPLAFNNLGLCLASGIGCIEDPGAAANYFQKSAALGDSFGMNSLGNAYYMGHGVPRDCGQAFKLFLAASDKGNPTATFNLACCYLTGNGVDTNIDSALKLFETAAAGGVPAAQYRMGCMCRDGIGCPVDVDRARGYFQLAADQAHSKAAFELEKFCSHENGFLSRFGGDYAAGRTNVTSFETRNTAVSLSPPPSASHLAHHELQVERVSQNISALKLEVFAGTRHADLQHTVGGISQQNRELLEAATAIHKRYEAKVTAALREFRREITDLEHKFSLRRVDEAIYTSLVPLSIPAAAPLSIPAAGTIQSKVKGIKSRPL